MNRSRRHEEEKRAAQMAELVATGVSTTDAIAALEARARRERAVDWLHGQLFAEESDFMYDSYADSRDRQRGKNPMNAEYQARVNAKREALGVPPLDARGETSGRESRLLCEQLIDGVMQRLARGA